jgi:hypothetical protein
MTFIRLVGEALNNSRAGTGTSVFTTGSGLATVFELLPYTLGILATLLGIAVSIVILVTHLAKHRLEMKLLDKQLNDTGDKD